MKLLPRFLAATALLAAATAFADDAFEGRITLAITSTKDKPTSLTYVVRGSAIRVDVAGGQASTIMNLGTHEMTILMHQQKMYLVRPMQGADAPPPSAPREGATSPARTTDIPDVEVTGKSETICGYKCNQVVMKDGSHTTEMWLAEGLAPFMGMGASGGGGMFGGRKAANSEAAGKWEQVLKGRGGFPLRVVTRDASGKEAFKMEASSVEKGGVSDTDFTPPPDYKQFQMPNLGGMFPHG